MDSTIQEQKPASSTSLSSTTLDAGERSYSVLVADAQNPFPRHMESALDIEKQEKSASDSDYGEPRGRRRLNRARKHLIVPLLCSAQFFDIVCSSSSIIALPQVRLIFSIPTQANQKSTVLYTLDRRHIEFPVLRAPMGHRSIHFNICILPAHRRSVG